MQSKTSKRLYLFFGISMAVLMAVTLFLPGLAPDPTPLVNDPPTPTPQPVPTFPPPITDFSAIVFNEQHLHASGLYAVDIPTGWAVSGEVNGPSQAQVSLNNPDAISVIEVYLQQTEPMPTNLDELSAMFNQSTLAAGWRQYTGGWEELSRRTEDDRLLIDFSLRSGNQQQFLARHAAWFDDAYIYVVRVVVPNNARDLLFHMLDEMIDKVSPFRQFAETPLGWAGYYDYTHQHIIRVPQEWTLTDGGQGTPASFMSASGDVMLRVEAQDEAITDEDAARAWVENLRTSIDVISVALVTREGGEGFSVAYSYRNPDGEPYSGQVILLNDDSGKLHIADVRLMGSDVDLNTDEARELHFDIVQVMETFSLLTNLNVPESAADEESDD